MPMTHSFTGQSTQKKTSTSSKMTSIILLIGAIQIKWLSTLINARLWGYLGELMWLGQLLLTLYMTSPWVLFKITSILVLWFPPIWSGGGGDHVKSITSRASRLLGFIRRLVRCNDPKILVNLYTTFICRPILEYGIPAWLPYQIGHITSLEKIQRRPVRTCIPVPGGGGSLSVVSVMRSLI